MLVRSKKAVKRQAANRRLRIHRARRAQGLTVLHLPVNMPALAETMIFVKLLPEQDRTNKAKVTAALLKALAEWC
jgi:hypothetical protein